MPLSNEVSLRPVLWEGTRSGQGFDSPKVHIRGSNYSGLRVCRSLLLIFNVRRGKFAGQRSTVGFYLA